MSSYANIPNINEQTGWRVFFWFAVSIISRVSLTRTVLWLLSLGIFDKAYAKRPPIRRTSTSDRFGSLFFAQITLPAGAFCD